jgi:hypothetical protein
MTQYCFDVRRRLAGWGGSILLAFLAFPGWGAGEQIALDGTWRFELDRRDAGLSERWAERRLTQKVRLPGSLPAQGIGDEVTVDTKWTGGIVDRSWFTAPEFARYRQPGNLKVPFWLQPERYYVGPAWYQRDLRIPESWKDKRVVLFLERPHWETRVWVDGRCLGTNNALGTPHEHDLGVLSPGRHQLTIRVDNRLVVDVGHDSHSVSDHTQGNWNGLAGRLRLQASGLVWIEDLQVYPDLAKKTVRARLTLGNVTGQAQSLSMGLRAQEAWAGSHAAALIETNCAVSCPAGGATVHLEFPVSGEVKPWDEFQPALYELEARIGQNGESRTARFGFRDLATQGTQFTLNGRNLFFRGTLECSIFPLTGHPPTDVESWRRVVCIAKAHGLNHIRFHSHCPPEAAFVAADELGFYYQVECSSWANSSTSLGDGKPIDAWIYQEADRMLKHYGNHPSFMLMPYGNEPGGQHHARFLAKWVDHYKARDARRLYSSGSGWPQIPENQFHVTPDPRVQAWGGGLKSRINALPPETRTDYRDYIRARKAPVISHEIGQWCAYPNLDEVSKYKGYLKPKNFDIFRDILEARGLGGQARPFLLASGKLQALCYKEDIESALRTPGMGGFQLLDLHDFPGQGTALVGVLDPFWDSKGYVSAAEFSRFCNSTVPLARMNRRVFTTDEKLEADLEVAHFGPAPLSEGVTTWKLAAEGGETLTSGELPVRAIPVDNAVPLGSISADLRQAPAPARYKLVVKVGPASKRPAALASFENDWDVWVYPPRPVIEAPAGVTVVEELDEPALAALEAGGRVLWLIAPKRVRNAAKDKVQLGFSSIFWNTAWTRRQAPTTLGILCEPRHPALADFPTEYHSNWQWWYLVSRAGAMILDDLPAALRPTVQVIDDWFTARRLGLVFEARVRRGRLLVCSIDLKNGLEQNPVARQMRSSLLRYMGGKAFKPTVELNVEQLRGLVGQAPVPQKRGVSAIKASSSEEGYEAENALDGDPATLWHTAWSQSKPGFPHELTLELNPPVTLRGLTALPRQDHNRNGWIKDYAVYLSQDGVQWGEAAAKGAFSGDATLKTVTFAAPRPARYVRLVALSGPGGGPYASLAEVDLLR